MITLAFHPVDTWFFRESRPMDSIGGTALGNQFPPSPSTLMGALRTRLGDMIGLDWLQLKKSTTTAPEWWGDADRPGALRLTGPWLRVDDKNYFPAPAYLLRQVQGEAYVKLIPGAPIDCDLGRVRLPSLPSNIELGVKPLEGHWVEYKPLTHLLAGYDAPSKMKTLTLEDFFEDEYRLGIAINHESRSVLDGQLYQTRHLRPKQEVAVMVTLDGLSPELEQQFQQSLAVNPLVRLGGEGRMAEIKVRPTSQQFLLSSKQSKNARLLAVALTDIPVTDLSWPLPGFVRQSKEDGSVCWQGELGGEALTLVSMATPKVRRQGGWDLVRHQSRPVRSMIPAGSVFYFNQTTLNQQSLHVGNDTAWGYGHLALGWWNDTLKG